MEKVSITTESSGTCFVAWTNSDLCEGRGYNIPLYVTELKETAARLGKGKNVQGTPCHITEHPVFIIKGYTYIPGKLILPSDDDLVLNMKNNEKQKKINTLEEIKNLINNFRCSQDSVIETTDMVNKLKDLVKTL